MPLLDEDLPPAPAGLGDRSESVWMERSTTLDQEDFQTDSDDDASVDPMPVAGYEASSEEDDEKKEEEEAEEDRIVVGSATFSVSAAASVGSRLSLETTPELFVASAEYQTAHDGPEEDISGDQALQLSLLKRLPLSGEKSWSEVVQTLAAEYKRTHPRN
jgi:hypothetical protein